LGPLPQTSDRARVPGVARRFCLPGRRRVSPGRCRLERWPADFSKEGTDARPRAVTKALTRPVLHGMGKQAAKSVAKAASAAAHPPFGKEARQDTRPGAAERRGALRIAAGGRPISGVGLQSRPIRAAVRALTIDRTVRKKTTITIWNRAGRNSVAGRAPGPAFVCVHSGALPAGPLQGFGNPSLRTW
jgi:hypothetical protein